jgi:hypothetical protein
LFDAQLLRRRVIPPQALRRRAEREHPTPVLEEVFAGTELKANGRRPGSVKLGGGTASASGAVESACLKAPGNSNGRY